VVLCPSATLGVDDLQISDISPLNGVRSAEHSGNFSLQESERAAIIRALQATNGIQKHAAALLNISRRSMHDKIKRYEITPAEYK
jgi:transcriptional regulator of acetoin/glycerol metabolism